MARFADHTRFAPGVENDSLRRRPWVEVRV